ncbi:alpha/beta hydrolase [Limnoglobus roseus]|uniref:Alpha/beta hydrolase n=1 Tax=Limnoglobus roseus TaxID=2598579 RepID=A0A5C1AGV9_9BACT|nr:alpha/beta hydrolase [Limnoglobus roseus]QEL16344.1 alpha/beta hydrolase [Limnoglobus roseus]
MKRLTYLWFAVAATLFAAGSMPAAEKLNAVKVVADVAYHTGDGVDAERHKLDLYLPEGKSGVPVVVFFHGGGYQKGDRKGAAQFGETLARQGVAVAAVGYRLVPAARYPAPVEDGAKAVAWVQKHVAEHGGAADRLYLAGHSAGGHLAALLATDNQYLKAAGADAAAVKGVISLSGLYAVPDDRAAVFGGDAARKQASPQHHLRADLPPFFLAYADKDNPDKDKHTAAFADALKAKKVAATVYVGKDRDHGTLFSKIADGDPTGQAVLAFIHATEADKK